MQLHAAHAGCVQGGKCLAGAVSFPSRASVSDCMYACYTDKHVRIKQNLQACQQCPSYAVQLSNSAQAVAANADWPQLAMSPTPAGA
jgi:hypothetical protein